MDIYHYIRRSASSSIVEFSSEFETLGDLLYELEIFDDMLNDSIRETIERTGEYELYMSNGDMYSIVKIE